jgi:hypothetical protein
MGRVKTETPAPAIVNGLRTVHLMKEGDEIQGKIEYFTNRNSVNGNMRFVAITLDGDHDLDVFNKGEFEKEFFESGKRVKLLIGTALYKPTKDNLHNVVLITYLGQKETNAGHMYKAYSVEVVENENG